jgi:hypothetical protein
VDFIGTGEVGARRVDPRDVACLPLDRGVAGGLDWFGECDPWEGREDQSERRDFFIFRAGCALLLFFSRLKRIGVVICLLISRTSPFSYDDCCLYPSFFAVYILLGLPEMIFSLWILNFLMHQAWYMCLGFFKSSVVFDVFLRDFLHFFYNFETRVNERL